MKDPVDFCRLVGVCFSGLKSKDCFVEIGEKWGGYRIPIM